jgi:hypothetical protein
LPGAVFLLRKDSKNSVWTKVCDCESICQQRGDTLYLHPDGKYELKRHVLALGSKVKAHDLIMEAMETVGTGASFCR